MIFTVKLERRSELAASPPMCHVLIIEDEPLVAMLIEDCLLEAGAESCDIAATEDEAVTMARRHPPGFITTDVRLRVGRGPSAVRQIRAELGPIPTVVITGELAPDMPAPPPCPLLTKPFQLAALTGLYAQLSQP